MKKSLLALAVLSAFTGAASAQSSVTLSGSVDLGVRRQNGGYDMATSGSGRSVLNFAGTEDLGGGMRAFFFLNHRFRGNNGTVNFPGGAAGGFWRNSWVGLGGGFGDVRLGRMLMPLQDLNGQFDPWGGGDTVGSTHTGGLRATVRANNTIYYRTPSLGGLFVHAAIAAGEGQLGGEFGYPTLTPAAGATFNGERPIGFAVGYNGGPVRAGVAYDKNALDLKTIGVYGAFNAGFAEFMLQFEKGDVTPTFDAKRISLSAKVPLGAVTLKAGFTKWKDEETKKYGLGMDYALSKRTTIYSDVGKYSGDGANFLLENANGTKTRFDVGIFHKF